MCDPLLVLLDDSSIEVLPYIDSAIVSALFHMISKVVNEKDHICLVRSLQAKLKGLRQIGFRPSSIHKMITW